VKGLARTVKASVLSRTVNIVCAKPLDTPAFNFDRLLAISTKYVEGIVTALDIRFARMAFAELVSRMVNWLATTASALNRYLVHVFIISNHLQKSSVLEYKRGG